MQSKLLTTDTEKLCYVDAPLGRLEKNEKMERIGIEKENISRIVANSFFLIASLLGLFVICVEHLDRWYLTIQIVFIFLFIFAIITEVYECIFYDDTHLIIRSFRGIETIKFIDIIKI